MRYEKWSEQEQNELRKLQLLTAKPSAYLINLSKEDYSKVKLQQQIKWQKPIEDWVKRRSPDCKLLYYSVECSEDQALFDSIINLGYDLLGLARFFTVGTDEVRSWTIRKGLKAPQASAVIHSDFEKGFVSAEVLSFEKFKALGENALVQY